MSDPYADDAREIQKILEDMFQAINWSPDQPPNWEAFAAPGLDGMLLAPSARPAALKDMESFIRGMTEQRDAGNLVHFEERVLGHHTRVFGNLAVSLCSYVSRVNEGAEGRGVNAFLLVKTDGAWRIASMAWDNESDAHPVPDYLL